MLIPSDELLRAERYLREEMGKERTPSELLRWIDSLHEGLSAGEDIRKAFRVASGPFKKLFEEVRPLGLFGCSLIGDHPSLTIQPMPGNQPGCDAILRCGDWSKEQIIEVTQAMDGHRENLRMRHLNEFGHAPAVGGIRFVRAKGKPKVQQTELVARAGSDIRSEVRKLIHQAAMKKLQKLYADDTWLLIVFDDNVGFGTATMPNTEARLELQHFFEASVLSLPWNLAAVYAIGSSGRTVLGRQLR